MKTTIQFSRGFIIFLIFLVSGVSFLACGMYSFQKQKAAVSPHQIEETDCSVRRYIRGTVNTCFWQKNEDTENLMIPIANNQYIRVLVSDQKLSGAMKALKPDGGSGVYIEGEIVPFSEKEGDLWGDSIQDIPEETIVKSYVIREIDIQDRVKRIYTGLALLFSAWLQYKLMGNQSGLMAFRERKARPV